MFVILLLAGYLQAQINSPDLMQLTNGPEGIWTRTIALHPDIGIFICSDDGSYYQSLDQGETWQFRSKQGYNPEAMVITDWGDIFIGSSKIYRQNTHLSQPGACPDFLPEPGHGSCV